MQKVREAANQKNAQESIRLVASFFDEGASHACGRLRALGFRCTEGQDPDGQVTSLSALKDGYVPFIEQAPVIMGFEDEDGNDVGNEHLDSLRVSSSFDVFFDFDQR